MTQDNAQPFLKWAGSKRQLVPVLSRYWRDEYARYVEPFVGSGALFFGLAPSRALLGDINAELVLTYREVKNDPLSVVQALNGMKIGKSHFLRIRELEPSSLEPSLRAARFIYLNRFCFNGLYRTNRAGKFNVPFGGSEKSGKIPTMQSLTHCSQLLTKAELVSGSFEVTLGKVCSGDFVYLDPPFSVKSRRVFNEYDRLTFGYDHLKSLRKWMINLNDRHIAFLVSYADSEEAEYLRKGFRVEAVEVRRNIAGFAGSRKYARELLISNCPPTN